MKAKAKSSEDKIQQLVPLMDMIIADASVPRNIRKVVEEGKSKLLSKEDIVTKTSMVIYLFEDIANDINMPAHTRTQIWSILSILETIKE